MISIKKMMELETEYACFNAKRTFTCIETGESKAVNEENLITVRDSSQPNNGYLNRDIIFPEPDIVNLLQLGAEIL